MGKTTRGRKRGNLHPNQFRIDQLKYKINKLSDILNSSNDVSSNSTKLKEELAYCTKMLGMYLNDKR